MTAPTAMVVTLHSSAEQIEVQLRVGGGDGANSLLVESTTPESSGGIHRHGHALEFYGEEAATTWLPVGTHKATDVQGKKTTFTIEPGTSFLELTLR